MDALDFEVKKINENIILVTFDDRMTMCETLLRIQEAYESPEFKDTVFTIGQYREYAIEKKGVFDYHYWVDGCNFPSYVLKPFIYGSFDPLTKKEQTFIDLVGRRRGEFYVIAVYKDADPATVEHELCHALWGTDENYRDEMKNLVVQYRSELEAVERYLYKEEYDDSVMLDEIHAYVTADYNWLKHEQGIEVIPDIVEKFKEVRRKYDAE